VTYVGFTSQHPASTGFCSSSTLPYQDEKIPKVQCLLNSVYQAEACDNCPPQPGAAQ